ncbi:hypothetical protein [Glutamicibacter uratoxydans]|uniref:hypothetical protein n=1 Tax=Glutamicibacter uratoxydans TaxID=43667 RepID=UPI003D6E0088
MKIWFILLRGISWLLPEVQRARYLEEWQTDLGGAAEIGIPEHQVVTGALRSSWQIRRQRHPMLELAPDAQAYLYARWAVAFIGSGGVLVLGALVTGGYLVSNDATPIVRGVLTTAGWVVPAISLILLLLGYRKLTQALQALVSTQKRSFISLAMILILLLVVYLVLSSNAGAGMLLFLAALITGLILMNNARFVARERRMLKPGIRRIITWPAAMTLLLFIVLGIAQIMWWNPQAKLPGWELGKVYAQMREAGAGTGWQMVAIWATGWLAIIVGFATACYRGQPKFLAELRGFMASWFLLAALMGGGYFVASFPLGMSLADTFGLSGADAGSAGPFIFLLADLCLAAAIYLGANPGRWQLPETELLGDTA